MWTKTRTGYSSLSASVFHAVPMMTCAATKLQTVMGHGVDVMFFLLRMAFWLTLALALLPTGSSQPVAKGPQLAAGDAVVAATAAVSDVSNFCERQAEACEVGSKAAIVIGQRAQAGAKMVFEFITDQIARNDATTAPDSKTTPVTTGTVPTAPGSQTTLRPDDLAPAWQGPVPQHEARPRRDHKPRA